MGYIDVLAAALAAWLLGALWYSALSRPWMRAAGVPMTPEGKPIGNGSALPFLLSALAMVVVAGMMRHVFALSAIDTILEGVTSGFGIGLFFITPWIAINNAYPGRPYRLTLIDGGYATLGCTLIGGVLTALG